MTIIVADETIDKAVEDALAFRDRYDLTTDDGIADYVREGAIPETLKMMKEGVRKVKVNDELTNFFVTHGATFGYIGGRPDVGDVVEKVGNTMFFYYNVLAFLANGNVALTNHRNPLLQNFYRDDGQYQPKTFVEMLKDKVVTKTK